MYNTGEKLDSDNNNLLFNTHPSNIRKYLISKDVNMYKFSILFFITLFLIGCNAPGKFTLFDGKLVAVEKVKNHSEENAIVTSELSKELESYIYKNYGKIFGERATIDRLAVWFIDGKSASEASNGKYDRFSSGVDHSMYFELPPGSHTFHISNGLTLKKSTTYKMTHNFEKGHKYFIGSIADYSKWPKIRYKLLFIDATNMIELPYEKAWDR